MRSTSIARNVELALWVGAAAALLFLFRKLNVGIEAAQQAYSSVRTGTTNLIETFFPLVNPDSMMTYAVTFPDGKRRAVPGESVSKGGIFVYNGVRYRLMTNADGFKFAFAV
jgi:hypothetical protein